MDRNRWIFTKDQLLNTPSRQNGIDATRELLYRQITASLIQEMAYKLELSHQCIHTAIIYMHRFYMFHSFTCFPQKQMAQACLFLAAKTEEECRTTEYVIRAANGCIHQAIDLKSEAYLKQANTLISSEEILLQTLGFEVNVIHAHDILLKTCHLIHASKELFKTAYFLATNSLHLTTFCLQHKPSLVACICIHLACQWSNWDIPKSSEGKEWYYYVDKNITFEMLEECMQEFLNIMDKCPSKLKKLKENKLAGTKRPIQDEIPSETPPMKRQRLEPISPAATMAGSSMGGKVHVNRALPIPNGHEQKLQSQQQSRNSLNVEASLKQKRSDHGNENVDPNEYKYQQVIKVPNIPTKWETVPNIQFKKGIVSNVNNGMEIMENKSAGTKRPIQDEIPSETPPMKRQRLEPISPAATMAGSSFGEKVDVNRALPIPNGHQQKLQSQQQSKMSLLLTSSRTVNKVQQQQQQWPSSQAPISYFTRSDQVEDIKRLLSDSGQLQMASTLAAELQTTRTKSNSMNVKAYLKQKRSEGRKENVEPNENKQQQVFKVPNIHTKWETVPNIQFKMGISSNVNTNINHK
ncbi:hypothetical protein ACJMK2_011090 [Sinanodonta woodiana]|uniref:Cyclin-like domain-containing protein n=2 Tax=Sinanodonta woodiana TaxID=1069815 RepID=A0ABD3V4G1_SINWO